MPPEKVPRPCPPDAVSCQYHPKNRIQCENTYWGHSVCSSPPWRILPRNRPPSPGSETAHTSRAPSRTPGPGTGLAYATLAVKGTTVGIAADASGRFTLNNLPTGRLTLIAAAVGYKSAEQELRLEAGETVRPTSPWRRRRLPSRRSSSRPAARRPTKNTRRRSFRWPPENFSKPPPRATWPKR